MDGSRRLNESSSTNATQWMDGDKKVNELSSTSAAWMEIRKSMSYHPSEYHNGWVLIGQ
jgi:hypothetical protein